jgi:hypothetical protein
MKPDYSFEKQLENLRRESSDIANYVYAEMAIDYAASKSKKLLNRLNRTPTFWCTCQSALQSAGYIALGRVFDIKSPYNVGALLEAMEKNLPLFEKEALATRKRKLCEVEPVWLPDYLLTVYVPTTSDVFRLRASVARYRLIYERAIMPVRHQYLAHRQAHETNKVEQLFAKGKLDELRRLSTFLIRLHDALRELFLNGRKPVLRPVRSSIKAIYEATGSYGGQHEYMVRDAKTLLQFLETAP